MPDRNEIIKGLRAALVNENAFVPESYRKTDSINDAIALLEAQETQLMTLRDVQHSNEAVTLEIRNTVCYGLETALHVAELDYREPPVEVFGIAGYEGTQEFRDETYGVEWRCWTSRPTDEQRKAVKWDG